MSAAKVRFVSESGGSPRESPTFLTHCQAKSMSMLGTKNEPGSEAIRDKNLQHSVSRRYEARIWVPKGTFGI